MINDGSIFKCQILEKNIYSYNRVGRYIIMLHKISIKLKEKSRYAKMYRMLKILF